MMECKRWLSGFILFFHLAILDASEIPRISECQYLNAASIKCKWKKSPDYTNTTLLYEKRSDPHVCLYTCSNIEQELGENGETFEFCEFPQTTMHENFLFFLADSSGCRDVDDKCWNCTNMGENKTIACTPENVILTIPPSNFRAEKNSTLKWDLPILKPSMLAFTFMRRKARFKLMYRRLGCPEASKQQLNHTWKVWYEGTKTTYSPKDLIPECQYETKVYIWLSRDDTKHYKVLKWGPHTNSITFTAPAAFSGPQKGGVTTGFPDMQADRSLDSSVSNVTVRNVFIGLFIAGLIVLFACLLIFRKCIPTKTKVPEPVLMISLEELKTDLNSQWDNMKEPEAVDFFPLLVSRVMQENNQIFKQVPLMNGKSNSFQMLIEPRNGLHATNDPPGRNLILQSNNAERSHLLSNEETQPLSDPLTPSNLGTTDSPTNDSHMLEDDALEPNGIEKESASVLQKINKNSLKLTTLPIAEAIADNNQGTISSEVILGLPNATKLECDLNHNHDQQDPDSLSPQTNSSGFAEYMDYITDTSGIPSSSGRVAFFPDDENFDTRNFSNELPTYLGHFSQSKERQDRCFHSNSNESGSTAYSSLPSVTSEYVYECCGESSATQDFFFKMLDRSACPNCKRQCVVKHPSHGQKRKSMGELPYEFASVKQNTIKNRSNAIDTLSLDSGCSPDLLAVSP